MLLYLFDYLAQYDSGFRVFQYLTLRAILSALTALMISFLVGPSMIRRLSNKNIGQSVREEGPESHYEKAGTPTMGGTLILVGIAVSTLLWANLQNSYVWVALLVTMAYGIVGFVDDYLKVVKKYSKGLIARYKLLGQIFVGLVVGTAIYFLPEFCHSIQHIQKEQEYKNRN